MREFCEVNMRERFRELPACRLRERWISAEDMLLEVFLTLFSQKISRRLIYEADSSCELSKLLIELRRLSDQISGLDIDMVCSDSLTRLVGCLQGLHRLPCYNIQGLSRALDPGVLVQEDRVSSVLAFVMLPIAGCGGDPDMLLSNMLDRALFAQGLRFQAMQGMDENLD